MRRQHGRRLTGMYPGCGPRRATLPLHGQLHDLSPSPSCFPGNERARSPPALLSQPSCSGQAARLRLRHLAAGPRPALCGYHESQPSRLPASEPSRRGRARSPRSHHSRAMTRTGHSLLLSRPRPTCRSSRRRPVRTPCLRSLRRAQTHRPAGGTSGRRRPLRTQPLPSAESCCCPRQRASPLLAVFPLAAVCVRLLGFVSPRPRQLARPSHASASRSGGCPRLLSTSGDESTLQLAWLSQHLRPLRWSSWRRSAVRARRAFSPSSVVMGAGPA